MTGKRGYQGITAGGGDSAVSWLAYDGTLDGSALSYSAGGTIGGYFDTAVLSTTRAIFAYRRTSDNYGLVNLVDISGDTPSVLDTLVFKSGSTTEKRICKLDSTHALVIYETSGNEYGRVIDIDGGGTDTMALVGSEHSFTVPDNIYATLWDIDTIDSSNVLFSWWDQTAPSDLEAMVLGVNTSTGALTENTLYTLSTAANQNAHLRVNVYDTGKFTVGVNSTTAIGLIVSASFSGTTISNINSLTKSLNGSFLTANRCYVSNDGNRIFYFPEESSSGRSMGGIIADHNPSTYAITNDEIRQEVFGMRGVTVLGDTIGTRDYFLSATTQNTSTYLTGFAYDTDTDIFYRSDNIITSGLDNVSLGEIDIEKISSSKTLICGKDSSNYFYAYIAQI